MTLSRRLNNSMRMRKASRPGDLVVLIQSAWPQRGKGSENVSGRMAIEIDEAGLRQNLPVAISQRRGEGALTVIDDNGRLLGAVFDCQREDVADVGGSRLDGFRGNGLCGAHDGEDCSALPSMRASSSIRRVHSSSVPIVMRR